MQHLMEKGKQRLIRLHVSTPLPMYLQYLYREIHTSNIHAAKTHPPLFSIVSSNIKRTRNAREHIKASNQRNHRTTLVKWVCPLSHKLVVEFELA